MPRSVRSRVSRVVRGRSGDSPSLPPLPFDGWVENRTSAPHVERLDDAQLARLNELLPWDSFMVDMLGRRFGNRMVGSRGQKKELPIHVPDPRILQMDEFFDLHDKRVLEIGCFEGSHTIALCERAASVTAVDISVDYVVKTIVRCAFYGHHPDTFVCNVEELPEDDSMSVDVIHHVGVLYHLVDPVRHVAQLRRMARVGVLLDTHVADPERAVDSYESGGRSFRYQRLPEPTGYSAGDHSKWLLLDDLVQLLHEGGFDPVNVVDRRDERNGPRVTILARSA